MITHIVLLKLKPGVARDDTRVQAALERLIALPEKIGGIERWEHGWNSVARPIAYDFALNSSFADRAAYDAYGPHPEHVAVAAALRAVFDWVICDCETRSGTTYAGVA